MAYRSDIPVDSDQIRDNADMELIQENFAALGPVALSGINALISGGANVAGAVPVAQSSAGNTPWFAQRLGQGAADGITTSGMSVSGMLQWDGTQFAPGAILSGAFVSGQHMKYDGTEQAPGIIIHDAGIAVSGLLQWDGAKLVPGRVISGAFSTYQLPKWDGAKFVPGVLINQAGIAVSGLLQWDGTKFLMGRGISGAFVADQYFKTSGAAFVPAIRIDLSNVVLSGTLQYDGVKMISGFAAKLSGITNDQILNWSATQGAFIPAARLSGATGAQSAGGEYLCHVVTSSGYVQVVSNNTNTIITGCNVTVRSVGGFTVGNGTITIPAGLGYTHAIVRAGYACSGATSPIGNRRLFVQISGGAQDAGVDSVDYTYGGTPWSRTMRVEAALTTNTSMFGEAGSPLLPISGGEKLSLYVSHTQGASLGYTGGTGGASIWFQVQCFKLTSGGLS